MNYCPNCGTAVAAEQKFCSSCGKPLDSNKSENAILPKTETIITTINIPNKKIVSRKRVVFSAVGFLVFLILVLLVSKSPNTTPTSQSFIADYSSEVDSKRMLKSEFYRLIGLTKDQLIQSLGEPTYTNGNMLIYEVPGWRQMYGFKNSRVHNATYQELNVDPSGIISKIEALQKDFADNNFWRISDYDNIKRYRDGTYEISIMPIKTDIGTYNLGIMAFRK